MKKEKKYLNFFKSKEIKRKWNKDYQDPKQLFKTKIKLHHNANFLSLLSKTLKKLLKLFIKSETNTSRTQANKQRFKTKKKKEKKKNQNPNFLYLISKT